MDLALVRSSNFLSMHDFLSATRIRSTMTNNLLLCTQTTSYSWEERTLSQKILNPRAFPDNCLFASTLSWVRTLTTELATIMKEGSH